MSYHIKLYNTFNTSTPTTVKVYKDAISSFNLLGEKEITWGDEDVVLEDALFDDVTVAPGSDRVLLVTLDTADSSIGINDTLCIGMGSGSNWSDGLKLYSMNNLIQLGTKCMMY